MAILRVKEAFAVTDTDGAALVFAPGDLVDSKNKWVKGREAYFEESEVAAERKARASSVPVEQATAAPGEKRSVTRPAKKTAAKKADE